MSGGFSKGQAFSNGQAMHIEVGIVDPLRLAAANTVALGLVAAQVPELIRQPLLVVRTALAAAGFCVLMQIWHLPVGPSELHLIGATTFYLLFGFVPTLVGFAFGLVLQAILLEPNDVPHLGINALSLMLPLIAVHATFGRRLFAALHGERFTLARVLRLDAVYYAGVTAMVGFWLMISNDAGALRDWGQWALAYLPVFGAEAMLTFATVTLLARWRDSPALCRFSALGGLRLAR
jgi:ABC-type Co2+ transport system permease subunit